MKLSVSNNIYIKLLLYMFRWQLSTPILAVVTSIMRDSEEIFSLESFYHSFVANLIGSLIFFWIDRIIFKN